MSNTPNRASNSAGKPRKKEVTLDLTTARQMLPLVRSIVTDVLNSRRAINRLAPSLKGSLAKEPYPCTSVNPASTRSRRTSRQLYNLADMERLSTAPPWTQTYSTWSRPSSGS